MNSEIDRAEARVSEDVPCLGCGCLCDDIRVRLEGNRVAGFDYACPIGERWFSADRPGDGHPASTIDGRAAGLDESLDRAAAILRRSRSPVIWGLTGSTIEGVASALALADRIGAVVDLAGSPGEVAILRAFQNVGRVSATLGEVKDRADVVVFWDLDPLVTHPRHWERYSVEPAGRFIPEGRAGRFVIVAGAEPSESSRRADLFIPIDPNRSAETFEALRALTQGIETDRVRTSKASGMPMGTLEALVNRLRSARYGAWFFGPSIGPGAEALSRLIVGLNDGRRFVALEMGASGNRSGAAAVLTWQAGAPSSIDYGLGYPRHLPGEASLRDRLRAGEVDAIVFVGDDRSGVEDLAFGDVPRIAIFPGATTSPTSWSVALDVARPGLEAGGTVGRVDGVMLPLNPPISSHLPTDRQILEAIRSRLDEV